MSCLVVVVVAAQSNSVSELQQQSYVHKYISMCVKLAKQKYNKNFAYFISCLELREDSRELGAGERDDEEEHIQ